jgi:uncharacterized protein (TIGR00725 family)
MSAKTLIGVMGTGEGASAKDIALAEQLGELIGREGWVLLTGGRPAGVMEAAVRGANRVRGALTVGVLPSPSGPIAPGVDIPIFTGLGEARNVINVLSSKVVITCGSLNPGTTSEAAFALKLGKPLVLLAPPPEAVAFFLTLTSRLVIVSTPQQAVRAARDLLKE